MNAGRKAGVFQKEQGLNAAQKIVVESATPDGPKPSADDVEKVLGWFKHDRPGRYWVSGADCVPLKSSDWPGYGSLPDGAIQSCRYTVVSCAGLKGKNRATCESHRTVIGPKS